MGRGVTVRNFLLCLFQKWAITSVSWQLLHAMKKVKKARKSKRQAASSRLASLFVDQPDAAHHVMEFITHYDKLIVLSITKATATNAVRERLVSESRVRIPQIDKLRALERPQALVSTGAVDRVVCWTGAALSSLHKYPNVTNVTVEHACDLDDVAHLGDALTSLSLTGMKAANDAFLARFVHLQTLKLTRVKLQHFAFSSVNPLVSLRTLHLDWNEGEELGSDIKAIDLPRLRKLVLSAAGGFDLNASVTDATLGSLEELDFECKNDHAGIVRTLGAASQIKTLRLSRVMVSNPHVLESLRDLRILRVDHVATQEGERIALSKLSKLEEISVALQDTSDAMWDFAGVTASVWRLSGKAEAIRRVDCSRLREISVDINTYGSREDKAMLEHLAVAAPHLGVLRMTGRSYQKCLSLFPHVRALHIATWRTLCTTVKLDALASLTNLETLELECDPSAHRGLIKLTPLEGMTNLRVLALVRFPLKTLVSLRKLTKLASLNLRETLVSNLQPLTNLRSLERLDVGSTLVKDADLMPLAVLPRLRHLVVNSSQDCECIARTFPALQHLSHANQANHLSNCFEALH